MNKTVKWILIGVGIVAVFLVVAKVMAGSSGNEVKVTVEKSFKENNC